MPSVNWDTFAALPDAATRNFELLCRALVRRHYGQFGDFRALANQPGVEFHLKLHSSCELGGSGRWYGWQCRWYDLPSGRAIGNTRRNKIEDAIAKTEEVLPDLTDWVLWSRYPLTEGDQEWFYSLKTQMRLGLWTSAEIEEHLSGAAEILRGTYFGELVLTPNALGELHAKSVGPIKGRWQPEVHQVVEAERELQRALGASMAWSNLSSLEERLETGVEALKTAIPDLPVPLHEGARGFADSALAIKSSLTQTQAGLAGGDFEVLRHEFVGRIRPTKNWDSFARRLRAARHVFSLHATNLLADMHGGINTLCKIERALSCRMLAVIAEAGYGKTQLAAQLTAEAGSRPAGILLHGRDLHARQNLDDLAQRVTVNGTSVQSFEALVAAVDATGQRAGFRLPIFIDGLNEAEDPRDWKPALASVQVTLEQYPYVLLICTVRPDFVQDALPDDMDHLWLRGFKQDVYEAVRNYFEHYRIDPSDADLPWQLLNHPLNLRMFCEVTNPAREQVVGVESMPTSLTSLFERNVEQVAARICDLSPRSGRYFEPDIRSALSRIGLALWDAKARSIDKDELRKLLNDDGRAWDQSIVRALEHDGILIRVPDNMPNAGQVSVVYDALAGHIVADALLEEFKGDAFENWLREDDTVTSFSTAFKDRHPLATDIVNGLLGLAPRRRHRRQLWPLLQEPLRTQALHEASWLEACYLDSETLSELATLVPKKPLQRHDLLDRLWITRAARNHPLDAQFLDSTLRAMSIRDRDMRWTEWVRRRYDDVLEDLQLLEEQWKHAAPGQPAEKLRARWVMWTLTSTVRSLRDHATRALYRFGCTDPIALFNLTLESLAVNDPYVPERMLAVCYGVAMSLWADPRGEAVRATLPEFANALVDQLFVPGAPHATRHVLMQDSALGVITLARRIDANCIAEDKLRYTAAPFDHLSSPFPEPSALADADFAEAKGAIGMDFGNYTIGRLISDRGNYDNRHPAYQRVRRQIKARIIELGYSSSAFAEIDRDIAGHTWRAESRGKSRVDRYGKKYSWIAFFEMYGVRRDQGGLSESRTFERTSDVDIDPSFPQPARTWIPALPDLFADAPRDPEAWIANGPTPDYHHLLNPTQVDNQPGPWALLEGFIEQSASDDERRLFTFLRGVLVDSNQVQNLLLAFDARPYPGNNAIPEPTADYYTYAGEIPWSERFGSNLRGPNGVDRRDERDAFEYHDGSHWQPGISVELPVCRFAWESYHSELNQLSSTLAPAPALCQRLGLVNHQGELDLYDSTGNLATMYRELKGEQETLKGELAYIRCDLLANYLSESAKTLVWILWGERGFQHRAALELTENVRHLFSAYAHIHRRHSSWSP